MRRQRGNPILPDDSFAISGSSNMIIYIEIATFTGEHYNI
jgi:hypothetical protein